MITSSVCFRGRPTQLLNHNSITPRHHATIATIATILQLWRISGPTSPAFVPPQLQDQLDLGGGAG
jgi:hypothetical protein